MGKSGDKHKNDAAPEDDALKPAAKHDEHKHGGQKHGKKKDHKDKIVKDTVGLGDTIPEQTSSKTANKKHKHGKLERVEGGDDKLNMAESDNRKHDGRKHGKHKHDKGKQAKGEGGKSSSAGTSDIDALLAVEKCPGCKHHCSLASPRCKKGRQNQKEFLAAHVG